MAAMMLPPRSPRASPLRPARDERSLLLLLRRDAQGCQANASVKSRGALPVAEVDEPIVKIGTAAGVALPR